jgi:hypothetical protein
MDFKNKYSFYNTIYDLKEKMIDLKYDMALLEDVSKLRLITPEDFEECKDHVEDMMKKINKLIELYYEV